VVSPMPYLVGYKPDGELGYISRGSRHAVQLIAIGPDGGKRAVSGLRLVLLERKYVSVLTRQSNGTFRFESVRREEELLDRGLVIPAEGMTLPLPTTRPGEFAYLIRDAKRTQLNRIDFSIAGEANLARALDRSSELGLTLKKRDVDPGEELEVQIRAPFAGAGLMTIERDKVYVHRWFKTQTNSTVQKIKVPAELEGNGYLSVSFHRDINSDQIYVSPLAYGVAPFSISKKRREVAIKLEHKELVKPGETLAVKVSADRKAKLLLFAVDEGILQVGRYSTPDPLAHFLKKRALEVRTAQILDLVLPEFRHLMSAPGGDGDGIGDKEDAISRNLNPFKRRRDPPVAYWSGILDVSEKPRTVSYPVPESFNGTLRVMAVAVTAEAVGAAEERALVRGDFVISANLPTFVAPGDQFTVSAAVANNVAGSGRSPVKVTLATSKHLEVAGPAETTLTIAEQREGTALFSVKAKPVLGSGSLTFTASAGGKSAKLTIDLSVRPAAPYLTTLSLGNVRSGEARVPVPRKLYPEYRVLKASFSALPLGMAPALQNYLEKFPHGCTEQLVSQAMPALVLRKRPEFGLSAEVADKSVASIISTLRARQNGEGGFGLWTAHPRTAVFASIYALHFLLDAKERGLEVPEDLLRNGLGWLRRFTATDGDDLAALRLRAYGIYVLTRSGQVTGGPAATLHKRLDKRFAPRWRKDLAGIYLAATYRLLRQDRLAGELISAAIFGEEKTVDYESYYDGLIRDAQLLYVIARHFPQHASKVSAEGVKALLSPIARGQYNTLSSAYVIQALEAYAGTANREGGSRSVVELLAGGGRRSVALPAGLLPQVSFSDGAEALLFSSRGDFESFFSVTQAGFDRSPPSTVLKQKLEVYREYRAGDKVVSTVKRGDDLTVHIRVRSLTGSSLPALAIVDLLPGGFEVVVEPPAPAKKSGRGAGDDEGRGRDSSDGDSGDGDSGDGDSGDSGDDGDTGGGGTTGGIAFAMPGSTLAPEYADVREDRVVLYGRAGTRMQEFIYKIRATTAGTFAAPPLKGESLYDRTIVAQSPGGTVTVTR
jgi:alpha-2-macroglobulin